MKNWTMQNGEFIANHQLAKIDNLKLTCSYNELLISCEFNADTLNLIQFDPLFASYPHIDFYHNNENGKLSFGLPWATYDELLPIVLTFIGYIEPISEDSAKEIIEEFTKIKHQFLSSNSSETANTTSVYSSHAFDEYPQDNRNFSYNDPNQYQQLYDNELQAALDLSLQTHSSYSDNNQLKVCKSDLFLEKQRLLFDDDEALQEAIKRSQEYASHLDSDEPTEYDRLNKNKNNPYSFYTRPSITLTTYSSNDNDHSDSNNNLKKK